MNGRGLVAALLRVSGAAALIAGCASRPETAPAAQPAPPPAVRQEPPPAPVPPTPGPGGQDAPDPPLTPGDWSYAEEAGGSVARFGPGGSESFSLRCDSSRARIVLTRRGAVAGLRVRTTYGRRELPAAAELPASDALLDEMVFSRGRFTIEADGLAPLIMPTWPEPARVVEDCRG